ncbi:unnamed protein product [Diamesa tonsa]
MKSKHGNFFKTLESAAVNFSLESLILTKFDLADKNCALKFFQTQNKLKNLFLMLDNLDGRDLDKDDFYTDILRHLFSQNTELKKVFLKSWKYELNGTKFMNGIENKSVESLTIKTYDDMTMQDYFDTFKTVFVNLKHLNYGFNIMFYRMTVKTSLEITRYFPKLESLVIYQDFFDINLSILEFITNLPNLKLIKLLTSQATTITQDIHDLCRFLGIKLSLGLPSAHF